MELLERIRGCLLAGAVGDALGYQVEFLPLNQIYRHFGEHGVRTMAPDISDDTQMTLFTAEGMLLGLRHHMPMPACVYQSYLDWYRTQMPSAKGGCYAKESELLGVAGLHRREAPGNTCLSALGSGRMGLMEEAINQSKGCGGVMRAAPCGMLKMPDLPENEDAWALQGAMAAAITHGHIMGYVPAAMLADMIHLILIEDGRSLEDIVLDSLRRMQRLFTSDKTEQFAGLMHRAIQLAAADLPDTACIRQLGEGWVGDEALAIAVYCALRYQDDLGEGLCAAVTHDGDSDSTGAIAGNILGAWLGAEAIPADWLNTLALRETVENMAHRLYAQAIHAG